MLLKTLRCMTVSFQSVCLSMLDAVSPRFFFKAIRSLLKPGGRAVVHSIVKDTTSPTHALVEEYIFPGGYIPRIEDMANSARSAGLDAVSEPYVH